MPLVDPLLAPPPAPVEVTSADGSLHARPHDSGVLLWTSLDDASWLLRVVRDDGTVVRGADPLMAPGGTGVAFDHEAPHGAPVTWWAEILSGPRAGERVGPVTLTQAWPDMGPALIWLKSTVDSTLSQPAWLHSSTDTVLEQPQTILRPIGRVEPIVIDGNPPSITGSKWVIATRTTAHAREMAALLASGTLLAQWDPAYGRPDRYLRVVGDIAITEQYQAPAGSGELVHLAFDWVEQARPGTTGTRVGIPGRTYDDSARAMPTYGDRTGTYLDRVLG